jgi:hypothetical protein
MDLDIEDEQPGRLERLAGLMVAKEADLRLREEANRKECASLEKERTALERAKRNLEAMNTSVDSLLSALDQPVAEINDVLMALAGDLACTPSGVTPYGEIKRAMRGIIEGMNGMPFSSREIVNYLRMKYPHIKVDSNRANISSYLRDFQTEGLIEVKEEGSGQRPTFYTKK